MNKAQEADIVQRTTKTQGKDTNMEQDYSIDRDFLSKINNAMTIKAKEMPFPAVVQVGEVEKLDERLSLIELCDGEHIMSRCLLLHIVCCFYVSTSAFELL